jgi:hypothetical protein
LLEVIEGEGVGHRVVMVVGGVVMVVRGEGGGSVGRHGRRGVVSGEGVVMVIEGVGFQLIITDLLSSL